MTELVSVDIAVHVKVVVSGDLAGLIGSMGQEEYFVDRLARQEAGKGFLLIAWIDEVPVGGVYVRTEPADEVEIRQNLPGVPFLNHLEVRAECRNRGIGTQLIAAAEGLLASMGKKHVALAVEESNSAAERLYVRLGYRRWDYPPVTCLTEVLASEGRHTSYPETCYVLWKNL